jgi:hypothetical protein
VILINYSTNQHNQPLTLHFNIFSTLPFPPSLRGVGPYGPYGPEAVFCHLSSTLSPKPYALCPMPFAPCLSLLSSVFRPLSSDIGSPSLNSRLPHRRRRVAALRYHNCSVHQYHGNSGYIAGCDGRQSIFTHRTHRSVHNCQVGL